MKQLLIKEKSTAEHLTYPEGKAGSLTASVHAFYASAIRLKALQMVCTALRGLESEV